MPRRLRQNTNVPSVWDLPAHNELALELIAQEEAEVMAAGAAAAAGAGVAVAPAPEIWKTNPYSGDFNPGTKLGQTIFAQKTKGLPEADRFDLKKANASEIHRYLKARETVMGDIL